MARKTKQDASITRQLIIDAAREVFAVRGVSRTTLEHIATKAGVTRGAVYWHFENKSQLFNAMREQVLLPIIDRMEDKQLDNLNTDPLTALENALKDTIAGLETCSITRQTFEIMMTKCEYVEDLSLALETTIMNCQSIVEKYEVTYTRAQKLGLISPKLSPAELAIDTHMFFGGLLHLWVKDFKGTHIRAIANTVIEAHMQLRRI
ncbi:MAG: TetR family transcriptional regulator [Methylophilaceae bacterium]|nr:TetR family transcriptional regulator [Methylophilaceae bacterium]